MSSKARVEAPGLWIVLMRCHHALSKIAERSIGDTGLGLTDFVALEALLHKGPQTITEIQTRVMLASSRPSALLLAASAVISRTGVPCPTSSNTECSVAMRFSDL